MAGLALLALLLLAACREGPLPPPPTPVPTPVLLRLGVADGAGTLRQVLAAYPRQGVVVESISGSTSALYADLAAGQIQALFGHIPPEDNGSWFNPVAVDGLVIVVQQDNPVEGLSLGQVQAIFSGRIDNWSQVGGPEAGIALVTRERDAGMWALFRDRVLGAQRLAIRAQVAGSDAGMLAAVAADPLAIGYSMMGSLGQPGVRPLAIDGLPATPATTASQSYPLTVPLYFASAAEPQGEMRALLAWLQSEAGQALVGEFYGQVR